MDKLDCQISTDLLVTKTFAAFALFCLIAPLQACSPKGPPLSVQDVMDKKVDPAADSLWEAVTDTITTNGIQHHQPNTDAEWKVVRGYALDLIEGARLLQQPRPVGRDGHSALADASTPGTRTAVQIAADIKADPTKFYAAAAALERDGRLALKAIDNKDTEALIAAGAALDQTCENCHAAYWYPRNPYTPFPNADAFGKIATRP
jgi:hypothetical protein